MQFNGVLKIIQGSGKDWQATDDGMHIAQREFHYIRTIYM